MYWCLVVTVINKSVLFYLLLDEIKFFVIKFIFLDKL